MPSRATGWVQTLDHGTHHFAAGLQVSTCRGVVASVALPALAKAPAWGCQACKDALTAAAAEEANHDDGE